MPHCASCQRGLEKRRLFKKAMAGVLPLEIRRKKKKGFGIPVVDWLRRDGPMRDLVRDTVLSPSAASRGCVRPEFVRAILERHESGAWDYSSELYRLLMLELWHREFIGTPPALTRERTRPRVRLERRTRSAATA